MLIPNDVCRVCEEIEPQDYDFNQDGLWICACPSPKPKLINGKKPIDAFFDKLEQGDSNE